MATEEVRTSDTARERLPSLREGPPRRGATEVTEQGKTTIADVVVAKIAGIAAREIAGVHELLGHGIGGAVSGLAQRVSGGESWAQGVDVEVGDREVAIDFKVTVEYGVSIPDVASAIRRNVSERVQSMTGLSVTQINIDVTNLYFADEDRARVKEPEKRIEPLSPTTH